MNPPQGLRFVSTREDGLCMRLNTILDAMLLAKATAGTFGFTWDEQQTHALDQQTTSALAKVFTPGFITQHRLTTPGPAPVLTPVRTAQALADLTTAAGRSGVIHLDQPRDLTRFAPVLADRLGARAYGGAFAALDFTPDIRRAIALARALPVTESAVAIHLRGGDILHGTHAHHENYLHKAPSVLEIDALIARLTGEGHAVWLIGQEPDVMACMARRHPAAILPAPMALGEVEQVIFDAVLMSRMQAIFGGNSGVTLLSRRLGGQPFHDLARQPPVADPATWRADPLAAPAFAGVSAAMKAHSYVKVITASDPPSWTDLHLDLITLARRWRPDSKFLALVQVCVLTQLGQTDAAETLARALLAEPLSPAILPEMGLAVLTEAGHFFPLGLTAPLVAINGHPALQVFAALRQAVTEPSSHHAAEAALASALDSLGAQAIDPPLLTMIDRFMRETAPPAQSR